ncbi:MAG: alpha/beta fold hydrolase [Spirochaetia bacterium]|nr:alpha/beta fold hydrolase [Spirochaetia bacterium]MCF7946627.1 alpha/beta fold hydrolase [Spirochaetia bacterium]MCF7952703.1 alpha/beta fold hydrolase [Spirochaetales bacterium]
MQKSEVKTAESPTRTLLNEGMPKFYRGSNGKAVLVIHGFTGRPHEMDYLGRYLNEKGYTVSIPRLPGHGTNRQDFLSTGWKDWHRRVLDAYYDLRGEFEEIYISGLSMGGLLALILAEETDCSGIALAAPAITATAQKSINLTPLLRYILKPRKKAQAEHEVSREENPEVYYLEEEYYHWIIPYGISQLRVLQKRAKKALSSITVPTLVIVSTEDKTVPLEAASIIEKHIASRNFQKEIFEESPHVIVNGPEKEKAAESIFTFIQNAASQKQ